MRAHLGTALSGPPPSLGSTVSVLSTMTATISPRLRKRRTMCSSTGPMFIPYPLPSQGPAWSPMLVSNLKKIATCSLLHFCTFATQQEKTHFCLTAHTHTIFKRCGIVDCELGGMKMMKQPHTHHRGLFRIQWGGMWDLVICNLNGSFTIMLSIKAQNKNTCSACLALVWTY